MKKKKYMTLPFLLAAVIAAALWASGLFGLWTDGMAYIANDTETFTDKTGHLIKGEYSVELDVTDLERNLGKEIYNDGTHRIYVSWLQATPNGGYDIGFRSSGKYSLSGATLVSGIYHETIDNHAFTMSMRAKMIAEYNGKVVNAQTTGECGLNYKDGDCFSFAFFPDHHEDGTPGIIKLTITDLYKNIWRKKE